MSSTLPRPNTVNIQPMSTIKLMEVELIEEDEEADYVEDILAV